MLIIIRDVNGISPKHEKTLTDYIRELSSDENKVQIQAAIALGEWDNDRAVSPLISALSAKNDDFRREVARALKEIGNKRAIKPLIDVVYNDPSPEVRAEAAYALGYFSLSSNESDVLIESLNDDHYLVRQNIAFALGKIKRRKSVMPLIKLLETEENYNVRELIAWSLGEFKDKRAIQPLILALNDNHIAVRRNAAYALGRLGNPSAVTALKNNLLRDGEAKETAWALSKILKKRFALKMLKETYKKKRKGRVFGDCVEICRVLFEIDRKSAEELIKEMLNERDFTHYHDEIKTII